jgi:hypothetical protein
MSLEKQGKVDLIINLINKLAFSSLLKQGIKTWQGGGLGGDYKSTINLVLALENLIDSILKYIIHGTEHGSNYHAIKMVFNILVLVLK